MGALVEFMGQTKYKMQVRILLALLNDRIFFSVKLHNPETTIMFVLGWSQTLQSWILTFPKFGVFLNQGLDLACRGRGGDSCVTCGADLPLPFTFLPAPTTSKMFMLRIWRGSPSCGSVLLHSSA